MWRSKKFILIAVLATVVLIGSIGGVVFARTGDGDENQPWAGHVAILDRVCEIYEASTGTSLDPQALKDAFAQAHSEMRPMRPEGMPKGPDFDPETRLGHLQDLLDEGKITKEQYDRMKERMASMPDKMPGFGFRGHGRFGGFGGPSAPAE